MRNLVNCSRNLMRNLVLVIIGPGSYNDAHVTGMTSQLMRKVM